MQSFDNQYVDPSACFHAQSDNFFVQFACLIRRDPFCRVLQRERIGNLHLKDLAGEVTGVVGDGFGDWLDESDFKTEALQRPYHAQRN